MDKNDKNLNLQLLEKLTDDEKQAVRQILLDVSKTEKLF